MKMKYDSIYEKDNGLILSLLDLDNARAVPGGYEIISVG